jgi:APA family basic amino acid/polyamine antiporter
MPSLPKHLGVWSWAGIVIANMIGAGVFVSAGFMAQDMGPGTLLLAWVVGSLLALCGTRAYATVAALVPRSGGEYRYISDLLHPALGYLAGWATLLLGFSAPIAINAVAAASFAETLVPLPSIQAVAALSIVAMTAVHALNMTLSRRTQNGLVLVKLVLVAGFVVLGLAAGSSAWPSWTPPRASEGFPLDAFVKSLFYIAYAFSGWNAAIYVAEEFRDPARDVPRSMAAGCILVAALYLLVNWIFVANLTPDRAAAVFNYEESRVTLGHLVTQDLIGPRGAGVMSAFAVVAFLSTMSAMMFVGPRVCAAMAEDGFLPRALVGGEGRPPVASVVLQGPLLVLLFTHGLQQTLQGVGAVLTLFSALTAFSLFWVRFRRRAGRPPLQASRAPGSRGVGRVDALVRPRGSSRLLAWLLAVTAVTLVAYAATARAIAQDDALEKEARRSAPVVEARGLGEAGGRAPGARPGSAVRRRAAGRSRRPATRRSPGQRAARDGLDDEDAEAGLGAAQETLQQPRARLVGELVRREGRDHACGRSRERARGRVAPDGAAAEAELAVGPERFLDRPRASIHALEGRPAARLHEPAAPAPVPQPRSSGR